MRIIRGALNIIIISLLLFFHVLTVQAAESTMTDITFQSAISPIPESVQSQMRLYSWRPGCPISLDDLSYIKLTYWGFDDQPHQGILIVNKKLAPEIVEIFRQLYFAKFPIEKMQPVDIYQGDDEKSMADNNTSAFNCRAKTGKPGEFSLHSYGRAIDINPLINPYINNNIVLPPESEKYLTRDPHIKGMITQNSIIYKIFTHYGWQWGGDWQSLKDYQHFQKLG